MMRAPKLTAIYAAELKVEQSRLQTYAACHRGRVALRMNFTRPSRLVKVAIAAVIVGFWLLGRGRPKTDHVRHKWRVTAAGFLLPLIVRNAKLLLRSVLRKIWVAHQKVP